MVISDDNYAIRKLSQVSYYRLSGFWQTAILPNQSEQNFYPNTTFEEIYKLYLFDKKLRILLLDIIERLEVNLRTVIAHEMSEINPLAYLDEFYINPIYKKDYKKWIAKLDNTIKRSEGREVFIQKYLDENKPIPFWIIVEIWDLGMLSKYYSILKGRYQNKIAEKFNVFESSSVFTNWLHEINLIRNLSVHHSRIWNRKLNLIKILDNGYFNALNLDEYSRKRLFGRIAVMWFLVNQNPTTYSWIKNFIDLVKEFPNVPNAHLKSLGLSKVEQQLPMVVDYF